MGVLVAFPPYKSSILLFMNTSKMLTTSQAALLFGVHESTIKRWSESPDLDIPTTSGGHRRILLAQLVAWTKTHGVRNGLSQFGVDAESIGLAALDALTKNDYERMIDQFYKWLEVADNHSCADAMFYLYQDLRISFAHLADRLIGGLLKRVGQEWSDEKLTVGEEHFLTQLVLDSLYQLRSKVAPRINPELDGRPIIVGCSEGCRHELGAMMVRILFEQKGFRVRYLGGDVPFEEFAHMQQKMNASAVAISFVPPQSSADIARCIRVLNALYTPSQPYIALVGGAAAQSFKPEKNRHPESVMMHSIEHLSSWVSRWQKNLAVENRIVA